MVEDTEAKRRKFLLFLLSLFGSSFFRCKTQRPSEDKNESQIDILDAKCPTPVSDEEKILFALVDTIVPGSKSDPSGDIGATETCALKVLYSDINPIANNMSIVTNLLNSKAEKLYGKPFDLLNLDERTVVAREVEDELPLISLLYKFIRSTFYASEYTDAGEKYMGFPGSNTGYINHPDFTYGEKLKEFIIEETEDGNLP